MFGVKRCEVWELIVMFDEVVDICKTVANDELVFFD